MALKEYVGINRLTQVLGLLKGVTDEKADKTELPRPMSPFDILYRGSEDSNTITGQLLNEAIQYDFEKSSNIWIGRIFTKWDDERGVIFLTLSGRFVWQNHYYSEGTKQYVFNFVTRSWEYKVWHGFTNINGYNVWHNVVDGYWYYSYGTDQYILNEDTDTWEPKTWNGLTNFYGNGIWTDGEYMYYSYSNSQYVLNTDTDTWEPKTWGSDVGTLLNGSNVWEDSNGNIYYSAGSRQFVLEDGQWNRKTWVGLTNFAGSNVWSDDEYVYYSDGDSQYILNEDTDTWEEMEWVHEPSKVGGFGGIDVWNDGVFTYYSNSSSHDNNYMLLKKERSVNSKNVTYDNSKSGLNSNNDKDAIDELAEMISGGGSLGDITEIRVVNALPADAAQHPTTLYLIQET